MWEDRGCVMVGTSHYLSSCREERDFYICTYIYEFGVLSCHCMLTLPRLQPRECIQAQMATKSIFISSYS